VLENALHASRELFERQQVTVTTRMAPANFRVFGDATRLEQALTNLLTNAAKYSERGRNVEVRLEPIEPQGCPWARIEVRDEGRGIPPDKLGAIFDIFVQVDVSLDRSRGGLGIGLSLVRTLVELHGGRVRAHSEGIGHGSSFVIELPLLPVSESAPASQAQATGQPTEVLPLPAGSVRRILIVEDNADFRQTLRELLAALGYSVATAATGDEGLELIIDTKPDVAIVDIGLPGLDGFEVARRTKGALGRHGIKLVAMTGYSSLAVRNAALEAGFDLHVTKPCTPGELAEILASPAPGTG